VLRCAAFGHEPFHDFDQVMGGELAGHMQGEAFPAVLVDEAEDAQSPTIVGAVGHEVPAPDVVEPLGPRRDGAVERPRRRGRFIQRFTRSPHSRRMRCTSFLPACQPSVRKSRVSLR